MATKKKSETTHKSVSVHPKLAKAITSMKKLAPAELEEVRTLSEKHTAQGAETTGCFLSDTGGQQHCLNLPSDVCTRRGGISVPTPCPNS